MKTYFAAYSKEFAPDNGASRKAWEQDRTQKITSKKHISIKLTGMSISLDKNKATAKFQQNYKASGFSATGTKKLELTKAGDRWLIVSEATN